jgi:hypothetical protein
MWHSIFRRKTDETSNLKNDTTAGIDTNKPSTDIEQSSTEAPKKTWAQAAYDNKGTIALGLAGATALGVGGAALLGAFGGGGGSSSAGAQPLSNPTPDQATGTTGTTSPTGADATKADTQTGQLQTPNGLSQIPSGNIQQRSLISESITQHLNQLQQDIATDTLPPPPSSFLKDLI